MPSINVNNPQNLGSRPRGRDALCVWDFCKNEPNEGLNAPLCMDHAKQLTVQVMLLTSNKVRPSRKGMTNRAEPAHKPEPETRAAKKGHVYFIRFGDRIKIGFTTSVTTRMKNLPHDEILALVPGTLSTERMYHKQFDAIRITGEWFDNDPRLTDFIKTLPVHETLAA
jgi:hypothetical protein